MLDELKKRLIAYKIAPMSAQNFEIAFEVYNTNQKYFLLTRGKQATIENSLGDIEALPPGCNATQKVYISICENGKPAAVLDLIEKYPDETCVWIGLLLVHGERHGKNTGSKIVSAVLTAACALGYRSVRLGVVESNTKALAFWQKQGFTVFRQKENVVLMDRTIADIAAKE